MTREFITTPTFDTLWEYLGLDDEDLRECQSFLLKNPLAGDVIQGTGGARKIRYAFLNAGKSGGIRIIYVDITHLQQTYLLLCYPKSKQDNLTAEQRKQIYALVKNLKNKER